MLKIFVSFQLVANLVESNATNMINGQGKNIMCGSIIYLSSNAFLHLDHMGQKALPIAKLTEVLQILFFFK